ncbi:hypothetical protein PR048_023660 [Dryococelus australis]|uniref:Uncharacterized protein n=1 Tax=Dryococelus australis TaxID=614101 RepID=A0ABQ9GUQ4_9NEOP|nr:hypothetical protein PR048_023660 [Dryococelus australis]
MLKPSTYFLADIKVKINNHIVLRVLSAPVSKGKYFKKTKLFFWGHSFFSRDRDFTVLKRSKTEYVELIITSSQKQTLIISPGLFKRNDYNSWGSRYDKKCVTFVESSGTGVPRLRKVQFKISQFMHFSHSDGAVVARKFIDGLLCDTFRIQSTKEIIVPSTPAYPERSVIIEKAGSILQLKA